MSRGAIALAIISITLVFLSLGRTFREVPTWSEERGWIKIAEQIARGERLNLFQAKSDFPSSFQALPIALLIRSGVEPLEASRIAGFLYVAGASVFLFGVIRLYRPHDLVTPFSVQTIFLFSQFAMGQVALGWHEITSVPLLGFGSWYFLLALSKERTRIRIAAASMFLGLSLWTLYTPVLVAGALMLASFLGGHWAKRWFRAVLVGVVIFALPVGWRVIDSGGAIFHRHQQWYLHGGEWPNSRYNAKDSFSHRLSENTATLVRALTPSLEASRTINESVLPRLEFPLALLALLGFLWSCGRREEGVFFVLPAIIVTAGVLLSNPTPWRLSVVGVPVVMLAVVGAVFLSKLRYGQTLIVGLACAQVVFFAMRWLDSLDNIRRQLGA